MRVLLIGGTGFIGYRLARLLAARGERVVCMDTDPSAHNFDDLGGAVATVKGDVSHFDQVIGVMAAAKAERVVNLAYLIGEHHAPHEALKVDVLGMANCFEAARILGVRHVVYAGSFAINGRQSNYGERPIREDDPLHGEYQYARHKIMNEWQALEYVERYGMQITGIRAAYVTGQDKLRGTLDHVRCMTEPALGRAARLPYRDAMACLIHADDMAEVFARVVLKDAPEHRVYNSGGTTVSMGDLAAIVRSCLPDSDITFEGDIGARAENSAFLLDNIRLRSEFGIAYPPLRERVLQVIEQTRRQVGLPAVVPPG